MFFAMESAHFAHIDIRFTDFIGEGANRDKSEFGFFRLSDSQW